MRGFVAERWGSKPWFGLASLMRANPLRLDLKLDAPYKTPRAPRPQEYPYLMVNTAHEAVWPNFSTLTWAHPENESRALLLSSSSEAKLTDPRLLRPVVEEVYLDRMEMAWLADICMEYEASWLRPFERARRRDFLSAMNCKLEADRSTDHVAILARLESGNKRVFIMSRRGATNLQPSSKYRIIHLDMPGVSCTELVNREDFCPREILRYVRGWTLPDFCALILRTLGTEDIVTDDECQFFNSLTAVPETIDYLLLTFKHTRKAVWKMLKMNNQLRFSRRKLRLGTATRFLSPSFPKRTECPAGFPSIDWGTIIDSLKFRTPSPSEFMTLLPADFFTGSMIARALMANALITAERYSDTHLLHITRDNSLYHCVFSHTQGFPKASPHLLLYDEKTDTVSVARASDIVESS